VVQDIEAHPLFRPLGELISRTGISLGDLGITGRAHEDETPLPGKLQPGDGAVSLEQYEARRTKALEDLRGLVARGRARAESDPVLLEYKEQMGGDSA